MWILSKRDNDRARERYSREIVRARVMQSETERDRVRQTRQRGTDRKTER